MNTATPEAPASADFEARLARLEGTVEQLSQRIAALEIRVDQGFRWMIGIQFTMFITLGTLILFKL